MSRSRREPIRATSIQVAKKAGVSQATVSRVFNGETTVSDKTRQLVLAAAKELGYTPNMIASSLSSHRTNIIAVVLSDVYNQFYMKMFAELARRFQEKNKQILFFEMQKDIDQVFSRVLEYRVDGVVVTAPALPPEVAEECVRVQVPVVLFNRFTANRDLCAVCSDNVEAGRMVANHFLDKGYTRFAFIGGRATSSGRDRCKGYVDRLGERGIPAASVTVVDKGDYTYQFGHEAMLRLFRQGEAPNAVFCSNDSIALGAMDAARYELGLEIPKDVGFVGFDDVEMCSWRSFSLTTVRQPLKEMADVTCDYLFSADRGAPLEGGLRLLQCQLIERGTT